MNVWGLSPWYTGFQKSLNNVKLFHEKFQSGVNKETLKPPLGDTS